jgi:hypothetical protein
MTCSLLGNIFSRGCESQSSVVHSRFVISDINKIRFIDNCSLITDPVHYYQCKRKIWNDVKIKDRILSIQFLTLPLVSLRSALILPSQPCLSYHRGLFTVNLEKICDLQLSREAYRSTRLLQLT